MILPQAFKIAIPPTVGFSVQVIKGTALTSVIGFVELSKAGTVDHQRHLRAVHRLRLRGADLFRAVLAAVEDQPGARKEAQCRSLQSLKSRSASATTRCSRASTSRSSRGEVIAIIGKSGSGKSTLLRCINGLEMIDEGSIARRRGRSCCPTRRICKALRLKVGMIFQQFNLFPHLTVGRNVMLSQMVVKKTPTAEAEAMARKMLDRVGLGHKFDALPEELSGGQQQRVAIARALAMEPVALLCDEITSALDPELVGEVLAVVEGAGAGGHDAADGHPRDALRPRRLQPRRLHAPGPGARDRPAGGGVRQPADAGAEAVPGRRRPLSAGAAVLQGAGTTR